LPTFTSADLKPLLTLLFQNRFELQGQFRALVGREVAASELVGEDPPLRRRLVGVPVDELRSGDGAP
jgi:hypothetical protein